MKQRKVDVIIPTYKPDESLEKLILMLENQTYPVHRILIMNTEKKYWKETFTGGYENIQVCHITREEFDHGGTRKAAAEMSDADIMVCMTQDAMPKDESLLEELVRPFHREDVKAVYARQLPAEDCRLAEQYTRKFNYPAKSRVKRKEDLEQLGIKTYFCSNVCAAYEKATYEELGGFVHRAIFNEDMIYAAKLIQSGYGVCYAAKAQVVHSHNYNWRQQFSRNFDLGVSQAEHPEIFAGVPSEKEGASLVKNTIKYLVKQGKPWLVPGLIWQSGWKYLGYLLGKNYKKLPMRVILACTMNKAYWSHGK